MLIKILFKELNGLSNFHSALVNYVHINQCFQNIFCSWNPFWCRKITTEPHILAHVIILCPDAKLPKTKNL
jgi:hypothetical protein